ncbi:sn-glycerol-3-phosphate-binding periplasmic ugpB [Gossypium arboreum]|uniref:sn-glycerol-3-phosphate-binding periplasmic ugpB n=1 Tax=Gossypium arboreum TaxID=29729 RepID=A0A0B0NQI0_GOSAR|nr:sn-glycerol-3-phosphate-binding periplasmic ugpB [Gossypium arboreum]
MSGTCIGHIMRASVRPCLGHGIGIETSTSVRHIRDMHQPWDVSKCKTCLGHASTTECVSVRPCLGHGIGNLPVFEAYGISDSVPNGSMVRVLILA